MFGLLFPLPSTLILLVSDLTRTLDRVQQREPKAAQELLPLVYQELQR